MIGKGFAWGTVATLIAVLGYGGISSGEKGCGTQDGIPAERVADYVHAVIESDRTFYTKHVVERMQSKGVVAASENRDWVPADQPLADQQTERAEDRLRARRAPGDLAAAQSSLHRSSHERV